MEGKTLRKSKRRKCNQENLQDEGDVIYNPEHKTVRREICYGKYAAYCPNDQEYMETVGFYVVSNTTDDAMPLGPTKEYALLLGNVVDNPEVKVV